MHSIFQAYQDCYQRMLTRCQQLHRRFPVLIAVGKTFGPEAIVEAYQAGARHFGENYVQEGVAKIQALRQRCDQACWHMIGPLQSNKTRLVAEHFDWVQSIDRLKIAQRLNDQRPENLPPLQVLIEVNLDNEPSKSGVLLDEVEALAKQIVTLPRLTLRGLMAIPDPNQTAAHRAAQFAALSRVFETLKKTYPQVDTLSMGMSQDWEQALEHGSTMIRLGSAIFGPRHYAKPQPDQDT